MACKARTEPRSQDFAVQPTGRSVEMTFPYLDFYKLSHHWELVHMHGRLNPAYVFSPSQRASRSWFESLRESHTTLVLHTYRATAMVHIPQMHVGSSVVVGVHEVDVREAHVLHDPLALLDGEKPARLEDRRA